MYYGKSFYLCLSYITCPSLLYVKNPDAYMKKIYQDKLGDVLNTCRIIISNRIIDTSYNEINGSYLW
ncbi:hypothetical protein SAMN05660816_02103 [Niastella yeongjuensis]|nr:hypothetical protein SAMN05660816_02103 [Niastella yeongjuensis]